MARPCKPLPTLSEDDKQRFFSKIKISGPDDCHEWRFCRNSYGYGVWRLRCVTYISTRLAYFISTGVQPGNLRVCHTCDNPGCCNPKHLFLGTSKDNSQDMVKKGRSRRGSSHGGPILTEGDVSKIRELHANGELTQQQIADRFSVTNGSVSRIILCKTWRHTIRPEDLETVKSRREKGNLFAGESHSQAILKNEDVLRIREMYAAGCWSQARIGKLFGIHGGTVGDIIRRKTWKHI